MLYQQAESQEVPLVVEYLDVVHGLVALAAGEPEEAPAPPRQDIRLLPTKRVFLLFRLLLHLFY